MEFQLDVVVSKHGQLGETLRGISNRAFFFTIEFTKLTLIRIHK